MERLKILNKNIATLVICLFSSVQSFAQLPLLSEDKEWIIDDEHRVSYSLVLSKEVYLDTTFYFGKIQTGNSKEPKSPFYAREVFDTLTGYSKVYMRRNLNDDIEHLIYDFGLEIGDTTEISAFGSNPRDFKTTTLLMMDEDSLVLADGTKRRMLILEILSGLYEGGSEVRWIEGIGSFYVELPQISAVYGVGELPHLLNCYKEDSILLISRLDPCKRKENSNRIEHLSTLNATISPMPLTASSTIEIPGAFNWQIEVFDMQGKQVYATKEQDDTHQVQYELLKQGVYFGIITLENGQQFSTKLVK